MDLDALLPEYDISDEVAVTVAADPATVWEALMDADLLAVGRKHPAVPLLGALRMAPEIVSGLLHGRAPDPPPARMRLRDSAAGEPGGGTLSLIHI